MNFKDDSPSYLTEYLNYIATIKMRSPKTIDGYYYDLKQFLRFLKLKNNLVSKETEFSEVKIFDISEELVKKVQLSDILEFLHFTLSEHENQSKARARKAVALRQFFKYLTNNKMWFSQSPAQNLELPSPKNPLPKHLTIEQATLLLEQSSEIKSYSDARDFCMLTFFLNCGMRLSELVGINLKDIKLTADLNTGDLIYSLTVLGKGSKERIVYLNNSCINAYTICRDLRPDIKSDKALFLSNQNRRISPRRVEQIITANLKACGLDEMGFSVHKLRHTAATLMYQNGVDVRVLKEVLGHKNLDTTQIYTHVANEQIRKAIENNPLANKVIKVKKNK